MAEGGGEEREGRRGGAGAASGAASGLPPGGLQESLPPRAA